MFPIHNEMAVVFGGALDPNEDAKYRIPRDAGIHKSGAVHLHRAKEGIVSERAVCGSYMDVIGVYARACTKSWPAVARLSPQQIRRRAACGQDRVNFDPDPAAGATSGRSRPARRHAGIAELDGGLILTIAATARAEAYKERLIPPKAIFWLADRARTKFDMRSAEGRRLSISLPAYSASTSWNAWQLQRCSRLPGRRRLSGKLPHAERREKNRLRLPGAWVVDLILPAIAGAEARTTDPSPRTPAASQFHAGDF
jgi:hypothetical protein